MTRTHWAGAAALILLAACGADSVTSVRTLKPYGTPDPRLAPDEIAAWGDSFTTCCGSEESYPSQLSQMVQRPVFNGGVGGETSSQILARIVSDTEHASDVEVFWMGRNNFADPDRVKLDIATAAAHMRRSDRHFIVLGILNGDYPDEGAGSVKLAEVLQLNVDLAVLYPENFIDVRSVLAGQAAVTPDSLRADELHLNAAGNRIVAERVAAFIETHRW